MRELEELVLEGRDVLSCLLQLLSGVSVAGEARLFRILREALGDERAVPELDKSPVEIREPGVGRWQYAGELEEASAQKVRR